MRAYVIANQRSGSLLNSDPATYQDTLRALFAAHNIETEIHLITADEIEGHVTRAKEAQIDVVVAVGGDGTVNTIASALVGGNLPLAVIPQGTLNLVAKDLGIRTDLEQAVMAIAQFKVIRIDTATVNGHLFLSHSTIGLHAKVVRAREEIGYSSKLQKILAFGRAIVSVISQVTTYRLTITTESTSMLRITPLILVAPHAFTLDRGAATKASTSEEGLLMIAVAEWSGIARGVWLALKELIKLRSHEEGFRYVRAKQATIHSRRTHLPITVDGEVETVSTPITFEIRPASLPVVVDESVVVTQPRAVHSAA